MAMSAAAMPGILHVARTAVRCVGVRLLVPAGVVALPLIEIALLLVIGHLNLHSSDQLTGDAAVQRLVALSG